MSCFSSICSPWRAASPFFEFRQPQRTLKKGITLSLALFLFSMPNFAQVVGDAFPSSEARIEQGPSSGPTHVPRPVFPNAEARLNAATFVVNYNGFTPDAQAAFQYAVDIWSDLLTASIPIVIDANWEDLPGNTLGSAGAFANYSLTGGALPLDGGIYPVGLANQLVGYDIDPNSPDINATFDSATDWYLGTDGNPGTNQIDFVSVVLHEIGHGLGFAGSAIWNEDGTGSFLAGTTLFAFDNFVEKGDGTAVGTLASDGPALGAALISDDLFWNGAGALAASSGTIKMYAPNPWNGGSSYSHFDEATYGAGDPASLMTPQIGWGEAIHDPGAMALGLLSDIGWTAGYPVLEGCTDPAYCNYNPDAVTDDGSCFGIAVNWTFDLNTDQYPEETTWAITDNSTGETVASGGPYIDAFTLISESGTFCEGCYTFTINDTYSDGICCAYGEGSYALSLDGQLYASGGTFGLSESADLCNGPCTDNDGDGLCDGDGTGACTNPPSIIDVLPLYGYSCQGGDLVSISGSDFCDAEVFVEGVPVTIVSATTELIEFLMPPGSGLASLEVITALGSSMFSIEYGLTTVDDVFPSSGLNCAGGELVTISGTNLCDVEVMVEGIFVPVLFNDGNIIDFEIPPGSGSAVLEVISPDGGGVDYFDLEYGPPEVFDAFPSTGLNCAGGEIVTLSGTNLCDAEVIIEGISVPVLFSDANSLDFEMPPGSGSVLFDVITSTGGGPTSVILDYGPPEVFDVIPSTGLNCEGGEIVVLQGTNLCNAEVIIDGVLIPLFFSDATMIEFEVPPGSGSLQVEVMTLSGPTLVFLEYGNCCDDLDSDGICDDIDDCVGDYDACGVCNGPGAIYECGCTDVPAEDCDCNGNQLDALGVCGGPCTGDADGDGICDDEDPYCSAVAMDGYTYAVTQIGDECWFAENLRTTVYNDGTAIPQLTESADWIGTTSGGWCAYDNVAANVDLYGNLYNWYAVDDGKGLCPSGWHVASNSDWAGMIGYVSGQNPGLGSGVLLKATSGWDDNGNGLDSYGFAALPGGFRLDGVNFGSLGTFGIWWTSDAVGESGVSYEVYSSTDDMGDYSGYSFQFGMSVRCILDDTQSSLEGCTDPAACNYDVTSSIDDGSCTFTVDAIGVCGGSCTEDIDADGICDDIDDCVGTLDVCGVCNGPGIPEGDCDCFGNQLDAAGVCGGSCAALSTCPDLDQDGIVGVGDILIILGEFGTACESSQFGCTLPEYLEFNPDASVNDGSCVTLMVSGCTDPAYAEFNAAANTDDGSCATLTCSGLNPSMDGYTYDVVEIGSQCWFAENLRTTVYADGTPIPTGLTASEWSLTTEGATAVYGEGSIECYVYYPEVNDYVVDFVGCDEAQSLAVYGRLYNGYAAVDEKGLCPSGWHVPTDEDWMLLEMELGMSASDANAVGWRGTDEGTQLKSATGWLFGSNGTDDVGFSALPAGYLGFSADYYYDSGAWCTFLSSSFVDGNVWYRELEYAPTINRYNDTPRWGVSVRCIRN